jgi:hypothetical protein
MVMSFQPYNPQPKKGLPVWTLAILVFASVFVVGMVIVIALMVLGSPGVTQTPTAQPTLAVKASGPGVGISRETASSHFQVLGYSFKDSPLNDGRQRFLGSINGPTPSIELIGDPSNLGAVSLTLAVKTGDKTSTNNSIFYINDFLKFFLPDWGDGYDWVGNNLVKASTLSEGLKTTVGNNQVTLQSIGANDGAVMVLSIKAIK